MDKFLHHQLTVGFLYGGKIVLDRSWNTKNVVCPNNKLYFVLDGEIIIETKDEKFTAKKNDLVLIPADVEHSFYLSQKNFAQKFWMHFDLKKGDENYLDSFTFPYKVHVDNGGIVQSLFASLLESVNDGSFIAELNFSSKILHILSVYFSNCSVKPFERLDGDVKKIIDYIKNHYAENITLEKLTEIASLSPNYLVRKFKKHTGYSPIKYLSVIKIEVVKSFLLNTKDPINVIMEKVGFFDSAHFSKTFKMATGYSPRKYREIYSNQPYSVNLISLE